MPAIDVVSDATVALKWFHSEGEQEVEAARTLVDTHRRRGLVLSVLDLTAYEIGDALLRGRGVAADRVATVLAALEEICPAIRPSAAELRLATGLAERHDLRLYDAAYAAVAQTRDATLVTLDRALLDARLGVSPGKFVARLESRKR